MTAKTAEHDTVMGALRSAQDVIEGILNATQALLTSLTYPIFGDLTVQPQPCVAVLLFFNKMIGRWVELI